MRTHRTAAAERVGQVPWPTPEEEVWRYSRIGDLDLDAWALAADDGAGSIEVPAEWTAQGASAARASTLADASEAGLGVVANGGPDVFATLNDAYAADPIVVSVPPRTQLDEPLVIEHRYTGAGQAYFPRLVVRIGEAASATIVQRATSGEDQVLVVPLTEIAVAQAGRLRLAVLQELGPAAWQIGSLLGDVAQEADLRVGMVGLGGDYARLRTDCRLSGRGANGDLLAAYFGDGDQTLDFRTFQYHDAPDTTSNLLFKGAVAGRSRSVYTGLIRVDEKARGTNAFQTNRNIKLSDDAWAESVPNLEIETNDVRCSHASTVGPVDAEQRFYLESRGVPPRIADRLIVAGFFDEVVRDLPGPGVVDEVTARIAAKLDQLVGELR